MRRVEGKRRSVQGAGSCRESIRGIFGESEGKFEVRIDVNSKMDETVSRKRAVCCWMWG